MHTRQLVLSRTARVHSRLAPGLRNRMDGASHSGRVPSSAASSPLASAPAFLQEEPYSPPEWTRSAGFTVVPSQRYRLGLLPTPLQRWMLPGLPEGTELWVKRDDLSGMELSGNKVRKLEFLLAEAKAQGTTCIITIGGIQSNHARATAVAAKLLGLECHLILRTSRQAIDKDPGLVGNLLPERLTGAHIHLVTKEEYGKHGSAALVARLHEQLQDRGEKPYSIPVGGSNALGTWGYLQAVDEILTQAGRGFFTDVAMACGSGGTTAGLALGLHLANAGARCHAYGVCDTPEYFYDFIDGLLRDLGVGPDKIGVRAADIVRCVQARGVGYAISTDEELKVVREVASATGVILDPVYSGKAIAALLAEMREDPGAWRGRRVLFVHTGGLMGMYDKSDQLQPLIEAGGPPVTRLLA